MGRVLRGAALTGAALLLVSCGVQTTSDASEEPSPSSEGLIGAMWLLNDLDGMAPADVAPVTLMFERYGGVVSGSAGCNRYSGTYELSGTSLEVAPELAVTRMACPEPVMEVESSYLAFLPEATNVSVEGERLTMTGADGAPVATFTAQSQNLAGTRWVITDFNDHFGTVVSSIDGTDPTVAFVRDGTLNGTGGCNRFTAAYTTGDGIITISSLAATKNKCAEPDGIIIQERRIKTALKTAATYLVEGDVLELRTIDDEIAVRMTSTD